MTAACEKAVHHAIAKWAAMMFIAVAAVCLSTSTARAQFAGPQGLQYNPSPALSPYLFLFQNNQGNFGALNNYNAYVRPMEIQNELNSQQSQSNNSQNNQINQLQAQLNQVREQTGLGTTGFQGHIRPTGQAATYMTYSHYYTGLATRQH